MARRTRRPLWVGLLVAACLASLAPRASAEATREEVGRAIREGIRFLRQQQRAEGSWPDYDANESHTGVSSLVTLALLTAGEPVSSDHMAKAINYLRQFGPEDLNNTYAVALQTMVFVAADPVKHQVAIGRNAKWLENSQIRPGDRIDWPGWWTSSSTTNYQAVS